MFNTVVNTNVKLYSFHQIVTETNCSNKTGLVAIDNDVADQLKDVKLIDYKEVIFNMGFL